MHAYQSAERKSGTSAEALKREDRTGLVLEKKKGDPGEDKDEQNDIVGFAFRKDFSLSLPVSSLRRAKNITDKRRGRRRRLEFDFGDEV